MVSNCPADGLAFLSRMADTAAIEAGTHLLTPVRLAQCDAVDIRSGFTSEGVTLESWPIRADDRTVTVSVFATVPQAGGGERMAATGRFTFAIMAPPTKEYQA